MTLCELFQKCVNITYIRVENEGDYAIEKLGDTLYIYLEGSNGKTDWINNFDFMPTARLNLKDICRRLIASAKVLKHSISTYKKPYKDMKHKWYAHRGFLKVWKSIEPYLTDAINDPAVKKIVTVGYSHGAALAALCHEYVWFNRPDLRDSIEGYGFEAPRVYWGFKKKGIMQRWERFTVIRNINDIVTHVPPSILGFSHVGTLRTIGEKGKYSSVEAHMAQNVISELKQVNK